MAWSFYNASGKLIDGVLDSSITNAKMADDAIDSDEIVAGAIDLAHMSANSIDSTQYVDGSIDTAHIAASQITNALMADDAIGVAELSASGSASSSTFLRGDNAWAAPGGPSQATQSAIEAETNEDTYLPPDLVKNSPGVAKVLASVAGDGASYLSSYNLDAITDTATGLRTHTFTIDFAANTFQFFGAIRQQSLSIQRYSSHAVGSVIELVETSTGTDSDFPTSISGFGAQV